MIFSCMECTLIEQTVGEQILTRNEVEQKKEKRLLH